MIRRKLPRAGQLVFINRFVDPDHKKIGIFIDELITNGSHTTLLILTDSNLEEIDSRLISPVDKNDKL